MSTVASHWLTTLTLKECDLIGDMAEHSTRTCRTCSQTKLLKEFYHNKDRDRYDTQCKECTSLANRAYQKSEKKIDPLPPGTKKCARCLEAKKLEQFYPRPLGKFSSYCRECTSELNKHHGERRKEWRSKLAKRCTPERFHYNNPNGGGEVK